MTTTFDAPSLRSRLSFSLGVETTLLAISGFWALAANGPFFSAALRDRSLGDLTAWGYAGALGLLLTAMHFVLLAALSVPTGRRTLKPLLAVLLVGAALASHFVGHFGVYLDPTMLRNVLRTNPSEARELLSWALLSHLLIHAALPCWLLWKLKIEHRRQPRALLVRLGAMVLAAVVAVASLLAIFQPFSSLMRNQKELRYLITPANTWWSLGVVAAADTSAAAGPRQPIGLDAAPGPSWAARKKPQLLVLVVGETARRANWGLNGYARQTTPELAQLPDVVSFDRVTSCGTNTEVSLPCMFAPVGRRQYDEARIRRSESLLHVLARAGVGVQWTDNQSGCKGVCEGLPAQSVDPATAPGLCADGLCLDEALLDSLEAQLRSAKGTHVLVLHQLGSHGPSYFRRYPTSFARFQPACRYDDLRRCSVEEIVNAYDNTLLYTDHLLAKMIQRLQAAAEVDTALLYVSDHGESLGEGNLFLHGMPYAIAPATQTEVPMLMWFSAGYRQSAALDLACLRRQAAQPASHDNLFHTVLGMVDVRTALHEPALDLLRPCRP